MVAENSDLAVSENLQLALEAVKSDRRFNELEHVIAMLPRADMPVTHHFTPGIYIRTIVMPAGTVLTSKIHRTEHPFFVIRGMAMVYSDADGPQLVRAPHFGITKPATRRALVILEDCVWTTAHANPTDTRDIEEVERRIIEPHNIPQQESLP